MNSLILLAIGSAAVGFSFAEVSQIPQTLSKYLLDTFNIGKSLKGYSYVKIPYRLKPFDCGYCLSFWVGFLSAYYYNSEIIISLMVGFSASILALLIKKII